jgi:triphosphoribosyl-dephospho-CoA synthase
VLNALDVEDARFVYRAIRLVAPGGLGRSPEQDVAGEPTQDLRQVMGLAQERDLVARQYANGFREVLDEGVAFLEEGLAERAYLEEAIVACHLRLMAAHPDTLIARKRGLAEATESAERARYALASGWPASGAGRQAFDELDLWLRVEGNARNPGTTADLVAASLFAALRQDKIKLPPPWPWSSDRKSPSDGMR